MRKTINITRHFTNSSGSYYISDGWDTVPIRADVVLNDKIAIEVKVVNETNELQQAIGQAVFYRFFYEEAWIAASEIAVELLKPMLAKLNLSCKVLDWENMKLYSLKEGIWQAYALYF